jgi:hypothetical protein
VALGAQDRIIRPNGLLEGRHEAGVGLIFMTGGKRTCAMTLTRGALVSRTSGTGGPKGVRLTFPIYFPTSSMGPFWGGAYNRPPGARPPGRFRVAMMGSLRLSR